MRPLSVWDISSKSMSCFSLVSNTFLHSDSRGMLPFPPLPSQVCMVILTNTGRVFMYRPRDCEKLIIYLKDINPDKWGTSQLIAFLQQVRM